MKKLVFLFVALCLVVSPTLASAAFQLDSGDLFAAKGGNGNGGGNSKGSSGSSSKGSNSSNNGNGAGKSSASASAKTTTNTTDVNSVESTTKTVDKNQKGNANKNVSTEKKDAKAIKDEIKQERQKILEESKNNRGILKTKASELRKQAETAVDNSLEKAELLETTAVLYEEAGAIDEAVAAQEEAVQEDVTNVERYKKLAKLMEKQGNKNIKAFVNGKHPKFDVPPVIKSGRTLVPIRAISQSLGAEVSWNEESQTVSIVRDGVEIKLALNDVKAYVNGEEIELDVPSSSINSRIVVPLRFISEAFNAAVTWDEETDSVIIVDEDATGSTEADDPTSETTDDGTTNEEDSTATNEETDEASNEDATTEENSGDNTPTTENTNGDVTTEDTQPTATTETEN